MRSRSLRPVLIVLCSALIGGCGGGSSGSPGGGSAPTGASDATSTAAVGDGHACAGYGSQMAGSYDVIVAIEDHAPILAAPEAEASTDPDTHVVVAGSGIDNAEAANKHVEVHICDHASGAPAQHLTPTVTVRDLTGGGGATPLAVAEVYAKGDSPGNVHYGNNVAIPPGHLEQVQVTVGGASVTFKIAVE